MASKRPAWVDDLEAFLRKHEACLPRVQATLRRVSNCATFREAWDALHNWDDFLWFIQVRDPKMKRWDARDTVIAREYAREDDNLQRKPHTEKAHCDLWRSYWTMPELPKAKPTKKGR